VWRNKTLVKRDVKLRDIYKKQRTSFSVGRILPNAKQAMKNAYKSNSKEQLLEKLNLLRQS
jgi:hypothetical protein